MFNRYGVPINSRNFLLQWMAACPGAWIMAVVGSGLLLVIALLLLSMIESFAPSIFSLLMSSSATLELVALRVVVVAVPFGGYLGWLIADIQLYILQKHFGYALSRFRTRSMAGGIAGVAAACLMEALRVMNTDLWLTQPWWRENWVFVLVVVFVSVLAVGQAWSLRPYVHGVWLWVLVNLVGGLAFVVVAFGQAFGPHWLLTLLIAVAAQGAITGVAALWLFGRMARSDAPDDEMELPVPAKGTEK